jgi:hypothetical protein
VRFYSDEKNKSTVMAAIAKELKTNPDDPHRLGQERSPRPLRA